MTFLSPTKIVASYNLQDPIGQVDSEIFAVLGSTIEVIGEPGVVVVNFVEGDDEANNIVGDSSWDRFSGYGGNDTLIGAEGEDILDTGSGDDYLSGGDGNDILEVVEAGNDTIYGGNDNDRFIVNYGSGMTFGASFFYGGSGEDDVFITLSNEINAQFIDIQAGGNFTLADGSVFESFENVNLITGAGDDQLFIVDAFYLGSMYSSGSSWFGGEGNDHAILDYSIATVSISASIGYSDYLYVQSASRYLFTLAFVESFSIAAGSANDTLNGALGGDDLYGNAGDDGLYGNAGNDSLFGGDGNDALLGQTGNDSLTGGNGTDSLGGGEGNDTLFGENGDDRLVGSLGDDLIVAGAGNDTLQGGGGSDRLFGSTGTDQMYAGIDTVRDVFIFRSTLDSTLGASHDVVYNFVSGIDGFNLNQIDANTALANDQAFVFSGTTAQANSVWYVIQGADLLVFGDVDGNATRDFSIRLVGVASLMAGDFLL
ncbi:MAG: calcium-binding protein [Microgenomates group bacterium]